jgi:hypothetical protein
MSMIIIIRYTTLIYTLYKNSSNEWYVYDILWYGMNDIIEMDYNANINISTVLGLFSSIIRHVNTIVDIYRIRRAIDEVIMFVW